MATTTTNGDINASINHFSTDLVANSFKHTSFLKQLHDMGISCQRQGTESLRRYCKLWLPLVNASGQQQELIPPPDIAWLWHCHRLAPKDYERYVQQEFGYILEAYPPFVFQGTRSNANDGPAARTQQLWRESYPGEPFFLPAKQEESESSDDTMLLSGFDLLASTERQATFLWQVSGERFDDIDFLKEGIENYYKFLRLKPKAQLQRKILVPTYQIDLMWHTHILSSITLYDKDCKAIIGSTFHHDDSLNDRSQGGILDTSYQSTKQLWLEEYGVDYFVQGGMYRGEPPAQYFDRETAIPHNSTDATVEIALEMGASSTSPTDPPTKWASLTGFASDGQPAFIPSDTQYRRDLVSLPKRDKYVLGKNGSQIGYFHLETKEAQTIICQRLEGKIHKLESDIAFARCCCGSQEVISIKEQRLREQNEQLNIMKARAQASKPAGVVGKNSTNESRMRNYYDDGGAWIYPVFLWDTCGGACGGRVACDAGGAGGCGGACSACGGGGCGGGGCGGGGCGGGGCGG